jgi:hypothetical protein
MRTFTLLFSALVLGTTAIKAQTVADFESLPLATTDTYYVNYSAFGTDVGFSSGLAQFPCIYDTSFGYTFVNGFVYSDKRDSVHGGYGNEFSAKAGAGYDSSNKYAVLYCSDPLTYANNFGMKLTGAAIGKKVNGFYITNTTYAYNAMAYGEGARKFHSGDWFLLTIKGYSAGVAKPDSVNFYLADYRFADSSQNYAVKTWKWVDMMALGNVDSVAFSLSSTDNNSFGMLTPSYFCMDNFKTNETNVGVANTRSAVAKVYPNPAVNALYVDVAEQSVKTLTVVDLAGNVVLTQAATTGHNEINTAMLATGAYVLYIEGEDGKASVKFVKQ